MMIAYYNRFAFSSSMPFSRSRQKQCSSEVLGAVATTVCSRLRRFASRITSSVACLCVVSAPSWRCSIRRLFRSYSWNALAPASGARVVSRLVPGDARCERWRARAYWFAPSWLSSP